MSSASGVVLLIAATLTSGSREGPLIERGGDPARGLLVNRTSGFRPFDPPDPARSTIVFIHGFNPLPWMVHFGMAERLAESLQRRGGPAFNVLEWDWNAATFESLRTSTNTAAAISQGQLLAWSLWQSGLDPARIHLIGHSAGGIVATSAAEFFARHLGRPASQLTLIDPAAYYHSYIFDQMAAGSLCPVVENYWAPGPSAYGRHVPLPGVRNYKIDGPASFAGVICPLRSDHLFLVRWYLRTIEHPETPCGFNTSRLLTDTAP
jgi:pimeloyl-ACP methyl ester carboxylesterase